MDTIHDLRDIRGVFKDHWFYMNGILDNFLDGVKDSWSSGDSSSGAKEEDEKDKEEVKEEEEEVKEEEDSHLLYRQQQLLDVLCAIEKMPHQRKYAPPDSDEIVYYQTIRELGISSLSYVHAKVELAHFCPPHNSAIEKKRWLSIPSFYYTGYMMHVAHDLADTLEMLPQCTSLIQRCKHRLLMQLSLDDRVELDDDYSDGNRVMRQYHLIVGPAIKDCEEIRLRLLHRILYLAFLVGTPDSVPTKEEVRFYARIEDHVFSALWMASTAPDFKPRKDLGVHIPMMQRFDSWNPDKVIGETREQYLREILDLFEQLKFVSLGVVPTLVEHEYYQRLLKKLRLNFNSSSDSWGVNLDDVKAIDAAYLFRLYVKELQFFNKMEEETTEMVKMVENEKIVDPEVICTLQEANNILFGVSEKLYSEMEVNYARVHLGH